MRSKSLVAGLAVAGVLVLAGPAGAAPATVGGCPEFGDNVATLGHSLGPVFGATASGAAQAFPQAFPTLVVFPEQQRFCG